MIRVYRSKLLQQPLLRQLGRQFSSKSNSPKLKKKTKDVISSKKKSNQSIPFSPSAMDYSRQTPREHVLLRPQVLFPFSLCFCCYMYSLSSVMFVLAYIYIYIFFIFVSQISFNLNVDVCWVQRTISSDGRSKKVCPSVCYLLMISSFYSLFVHVLLN